MFNFLKNKSILQLEKQYFSSFNFIVLAVFLLMFFALTWQVMQVEFWRHDAWGYSISEVHEFKSSARWGAPVAHHILGWIPHEARDFDGIAIPATFRGRGPVEPPGT